MSRICAIVGLLILVVAVPASAITPPTIDSVTPSTTSVVNGGNVIITFAGTCGSEITQAGFGMQSPQGVSYGTNIQTTTNGNRWTGQASYTFAPDAPSGQYKIGRINVQDTAQNYVSKDFIPEVIINVQNSVLAQPPTIDSVTPSTTSVVNGGNVIITFTGTCGSQITSAAFGMITPQSVSHGTSIQTTTNGNRWTGQASYNFAPDAPSGQYKIGRINVQDAAQNYVSKDFIPEVIINVQNSVSAQPPTIDSVTPSTTSVVNGGNVIITFTGTCGSQITSAAFGMITPQSVSHGTSIQTTTNGNRWTGQASYNFAPDAPSGQYKIGNIDVQDAAQNYVSKIFIPEVIINVQNSGQFTPTSTVTQTASPTTIPFTTSKTTSITTTPTIPPTTIIATTVVQTTVHTTITSPRTLIPTTGQTTVVTTVPTLSQTTSLTTATTPTITSTPTSSVEKLLEEQNKKIEEQNRLMAEQNKKMSEQNDLLTQILNYFKGIFGWK